ncbi:uncharacterized protein N0V89_005788 [Didymosphaeria variabile]|uniref:DUF7607 domain-containing protein n=1 Tax=Didymosphaeria variabile TaxID=1932322 RepID=A0A9W8XLD9_9PLEO|nr:uncharacterized protein N0V89_005788 [Didymosphaeria variabile]KAJ4354055.1 hypothetical protein N0V89_005788 [Didymosphaeria variabile]
MLPATASPSANGDAFDHLLHWDREEGDTIVEWDQEGWSEDDEEEDDEDEGAASIHAVDGEVESIANGLEYNSLDAEEVAIRQLHQHSRERAGKVPKEVVIGIINESIEAFMNEWSPSKINEIAPESKEQSLDPIRLWEDGEALNRRGELIEKYKFEVRLFENKLDRLAEEICKIPQKSEKQTRQHCRNLEMHVHNLEAAKWYLSIYELPPADTGDGSDHEQHRIPATQGSTSGHDAEVIDLGSSPESSQHGDEREMLVDAEEPAVTQCTLANPSTMTSDLTAPRTLELVRLKSTVTESEGVSPIDPDGASVSPAARHAESRSRKSQKGRGSRPEIASILTVSGWDMQDLVAAKDRKRIIMKVMLGMSREERAMIHKRIRALKKANLLKEISTCIDMLYRKEQKMLGVLPSDLPKIMGMTSFFLCWWLADDYMRKTPSDQQLHELVTGLHQCDDLSTFYDWVYFILNRNFSEEAFRNAQAPSQEEIIVISDDDESKSAKSLSRKEQTPRRVQARHLPQDNVITLD